MENFVVSARKYRPSTFNEVVGQQSITNTLKNAIKNNHVAQAFLFTGPRGVGKTTCARIFAKTINCTNLSADLEPCNECDSCVSFNSSSSFNVHELDAASNNSVEDIRRLVEQVRIPPQVGKYKVYIIDEVHMLSQAAFNAFLKTLEEPPSYAKFILATTEKHKIIPTILSRCQIYDFNRITVGDIAEHLRYVADKEGIEADDDALHIIARKADGALRDALSIFDQMVSFGGKRITYESALENLNVLDVEYYFRLTDHLLRGDITNSLLLYEEVVAKGFEGHHFIVGLAEHFRNLLIVKDKQTARLLEVAEITQKRLMEQSEFCSLNFLIKALDIATTVDFNYKTASNKRLYMELNLMKLCGLNGNISDKSVKMPEQRKEKPAAPEVATKERKAEESTSDKKLKAPPVIKPQSQAKTVAAPVENKEEKSKQSKPVAEESQKTEKRSNKYNAQVQGFSIKADLESASKVKAEEKDYAKELEETFDEVENIIDKKKLKEAVLEYAKNIKSEQMAFSAALNSDKIFVEDKNKIKLVLTSKALDDNDLKHGLLSFLREKFDERTISITTEIIEEEVTAKDEPMENYIELKKKNPAVDKIRTQLDLGF